MIFNKILVFFSLRNFHKLIKNAYEAIACFILRRINLNKVRKDGNTLLQRAVKENNYKKANMLMKCGADVNMRDKTGDTLLYGAVYQGMCKRAEQFIKYGADVNVVNEEGDTPLHTAIKRNCHAMVTLLIRSGAEINKANRRGNTPLHTAIEESNYAMVTLLIRSGAEINLYNKGGYMPLALATFKYRREPQEITQSIVLVFMITLLLKNIDAQKPATINREQSLSTLWNDCKTEIEALSKVIFSIKSLGTLSLIDVLKEKDENKLALIAKNKEVKKILETLILNNKYYYFSEEIKVQLQKGITRNQALHTAYNSIFTFNANRELNEDCWKEILKNLSQEDLKNVTRAASFIFKKSPSNDGCNFNSAIVENKIRIYT